MVVEVAHEIQKEALGADPAQLNTKMTQLQESYRVLDSFLSNPVSVAPSAIREAMVIADFPIYFGQAISRSFYADYPSRVGSWKDYCFIDETPDFRLVDRMRTNEFTGLVKRSELGQAKQEQLAQTRIQYAVDEYAKGFSISWRTLINDDMGEIARFPQKLLRAALRFEDAYASALYDNTTTQAALVALGANYAAVCGVTVAGLKAAYEAFLNRTDAQGNPLNIAPKYVVTSPVHELTFREILAGIDPALTAPAITRVTKDLLQWRADPYIGVATDYYLLADPADIPAVTVARLRGYARPQVFLKAPDMVPFAGGGSLGTPSWLTGDFENGEIEFMVLDIVGGWNDATYVGVTDFQGIFYAHA
jgi:hypothetical protein